MNLGWNRMNRSHVDKAMPEVLAGLVWIWFGTLGVYLFPNQSTPLAFLLSLILVPIGIGILIGGAYVLGTIVFKIYDFSGVEI